MYDRNLINPNHEPIRHNQPLLLSLPSDNLQQELQRQSLTNIPIKKNKEKEKRKEKKRYLLTNINSVLYLLSAYHQSTPLAVLVPPFLLITTIN